MRAGGSAGATLGIDVGGTFLKAGIVRGARILRQQVEATARFSSSPGAMEAGIARLAQELMVAADGRIRVVGVGIPGLVLYPAGVVQSCANLPRWRNIPLRVRLERRLGVRVRLDNDVNLMTLAEWRYGAGRGAENLVCVTLGTGVGGGLVLGGRLYRSRRGPSGEIGHVAVGELGPRCSCGGQGCLERYVGNREVVRSVRARLRAGARSRIRELVGGRLERITPEVIDQACTLGDRFAQRIWEEAGQKIGLVLAKVVNLVSPDRIVIGGGIAKAGKWLLGPIRETVRRRAMRGLRAVPVVPARLGSSAGMIGAALLAREALEGCD